MEIDISGYQMAVVVFFSFARCSRSSRCWQLPSRRRLRFTKSSNG